MVVWLHHGGMLDLSVDLDDSFGADDDHFEVDGVLARVGGRIVGDDPSKQLLVPFCERPDVGQRPLHSNYLITHQSIIDWLAYNNWKIDSFAAILFK
jgi:hypothetical protein